MCKDLYVNGRKLDVVDDTGTGKCFQSEAYGGLEVMEVKQELRYLGDIVSVMENTQRMCMQGKIELLVLLLAKGELNRFELGADKRTRIWFSS